jgi:outer membrane protein assembly factor BamB
MTARLLTPALVLGLAALTAAAGDWPQWRGPDRDARAVGFAVPAAWPKAPAKKWATPVGEGVSSPALVGDKVYVFTREGGDEVLRCLNAADGSEVWKDQYAAKPPTGGAAGFKGSQSFKGPRSSPAVTDGKVCTLGVGGVVSCLDAAGGKVLWRKDTGSFPMFYTACSPLVADGLCVVMLGTGGKGKGKAELTAFDLASGEVKWKAPGDVPGYGSPAVLTAGGVKQVVAQTEQNLMGVELASGKLLWKQPLAAGRYATATPVVDGATVICAGHAFAVEKAADAFAVKQVWKGQAPHQYNTPVLKDGVLYGLMGQGRATTLFAQDAKTGKTLWTDPTPRGECGEVVDAGGVLVLLSSTSELVAFKPSKEAFEEVAKYKVADTATWSYPILDGKRVIVKDNTSVIAWALE